MPRPRVHDLEHVLDVVEALTVESGPAAVTVRAVSTDSAMSNGAIYHSFGSRAGLLGHVWLRAARRFLALQREMVDHVLEDRRTSAADAVVAAADAPARFLDERPASGMFLLTVSRDDIGDLQDLPTDLAVEMSGTDRRLADLFRHLAHAVWGRNDRLAVEVIRDCVVELPTALLLRGQRPPDPAVRDRLAAAVRGALTVPPPPRDPEHHATARPNERTTR